MKNIIFDLDGTLLNTIEDLANSTNYALKACGFPQHSIEEITQMVGNGVLALIQQAVPSGSSDKEIKTCFETFKKHYAKHCMDRTAPYNGIITLFQTLKAKGVKTAIVSNKLDSAVKELNQIFFSDYISIAIGETDNVSRKPAPDMLYKAMELLKSNQQETIYVGDSEVDIETAKNAGVPYISVLWGFRDYDFLVAHGATTLVKTPHDIINYI